MVDEDKEAITGLFGTSGAGAQTGPGNTGSRTSAANGSSCLLL